jgi:uncharacterized protein (DUF697 family)
MKATAAVSAGIAAAPIPLADIVPLTTLQTSLVAAIAWIAGRSVDRKGAVEFVTGIGANVGVAFALREAVRAVMKVVAPGGGAVVSATIAFTGTMAIGSAARAYYIRGLSFADARRAFRRRGKDAAPPADVKTAGDTDRHEASGEAPRDSDDDGSHGTTGPS